MPTTKDRVSKYPEFDLLINKLYRLTRRYGTHTVLTRLKVHLCPKLLYFQFQLEIPICLFWSANFIFGNPKEANWNTKSEIGNIEVLDISPKKLLVNFFQKTPKDFQNYVQNFHVSNLRLGVPICFFWISKHEIGTPK